MVEPLSIEGDYDEENDEYYVVIDGERHGPIDEDDLREFASQTHLHFGAFKYAPSYTPEEQENSSIEEPEPLPDEEIVEELEKLEEEIEED